MTAAVKLQVTISSDRIVRLPDAVPEGRAEIIVLFAETRAGDEQPHEVVAAEPAASAPAEAAGATGEPDYFTRLVARQPASLSSIASRELDEAERGER